jgi:glycosyltransferase involved in cell wall biosynthesis
LNPEKKYALFFGFIRDYKGLDLLIDAMKTVSEDVELIVAGEVYGSFQKYEQQIAQAGLSNRIHVFNRYISDAEVAQFYGAADVCVLPYKSATQSGITAISFHFEVPIIATNVGGLAETVKHQKTGVVVDSPDSSLIATAINTYFKEDLKEAMVTEIQQYKQEHSWKKFAEQLVDFAKEMRSKKH